MTGPTMTAAASLAGGAGDLLGWLPPDLRNDQDLIAAAGRVERATARAFAVWLRAARRACLHRTVTVTAAAAAAAAPAAAPALVLPPDPDAVAGTSAVWTTAVATQLLPTIDQLLTRRLTTLIQSSSAPAAGDAVSADPAQVLRQVYLPAVATRLADIPLAGYTRILDLTQAAATTNTAVGQLPALADAALRPAAWVSDITDIAHRETLAAWHAATLTGWQTTAAGGGPVKEWVAVLDHRTRPSHADAHGQQVPLDATFTVGGCPMQYPGDPIAPLRETANCRCTLRNIPASDLTAAATPATAVAAQPTRQEEPTMPPTATTTSTATPTSAATTSTADPPAGSRPRWSGLLAPIGAPTGDGRMFATDAITARPTPLPLLWQRVTAEGHDGSVIIGRADTITISSDGVRGEGVLFGEVPETAEARMFLSEGVIGPSVDLDDVTWTLADADGQPLDDATAEELFWAGDAELLQLVTHGRVSAATLVAIPAFAEARALDIVDDPATGAADDPATAAPQPPDTATLAATGDLTLPLAAGDTAWAPADATARIVAQATAADGTVDPAQLGQAYLWVDNTADPTDPAAYQLLFADLLNGTLTAVPAAIEAAATAVDTGVTTIPDSDIDAIRAALDELYTRMAAEFDDPSITPPWNSDDSGEGGPAAPDLIPAGIDELLAAGGPPRPPRAWFDDPHLAAPTPLSIGDDGRVAGHLATWNTCHIAYPGACVTPPRSASGYAFFHTGETVCDTGERLAVGKLTIGTGHADPQATHRTAAAHYDNTATAAAIVRAGEDEHGIWVAGALVDDLDDRTMAQLRRSPLSGDWRRIGANLELVAALAVNVPGFPIPRAATRAGQPTALLAAGCLPPAGPPAAPASGRIGRRNTAAGGGFSPANLAEAIGDRVARRLADDAARARTVARLARRIGRDPASRIAAARARLHRTTNQQGD